MKDQLKSCSVTARLSCLVPLSALQPVLQPSTSVLGMPIGTAGHRLCFSAVSVLDCGDHMKWLKLPSA